MAVPCSPWEISWATLTEGKITHNVVKRLSLHALIQTSIQIVDEKSPFIPYISYLCTFCACLFFGFFLVRIATKYVVYEWKWALKRSLKQV